MGNGVSNVVLCRLLSKQEEVTTLQGSNKMLEVQEISISDIIEAVAEGYSDTEDANPWESTDNAEVIIMEEINNEQ